MGIRNMLSGDKTGAVMFLHCSLGIMKRLEDGELRMKDMWWEQGAH